VFIISPHGEITEMRLVSIRVLKKDFLVKDFIQFKDTTKALADAESSFGYAHTSYDGDIASYS